MPRSLYNVQSQHISHFLTDQEKNAEEESITADKSEAAGI